MNTVHYGSGNIFKVKRRKHFCYRCDSELIIHTDRKVVNSRSLEAKYYDFSVGAEGTNIIGDCEFVHKVFYCLKCGGPIEFATQISLEDIDIIIKKVENYFTKKKLSISLKKSYEKNDNSIVDRISFLAQISNLCISVFLDGKEITIYKSPLLRHKSFERPYYFRLKKRKLIKHIKKCLKQI